MACGFVAFVIVVRSGRLPAGVAEAVSDAAFVAFGLIYVPLAVRNARSASGRLRSAWLVMAAALA